MRAFTLFWTVPVSLTINLLNGRHDSQNVLSGRISQPYAYFSSTAECTKRKTIELATIVNAEVREARKLPFPRPPPPFQTHTHAHSWHSLPLAQFLSRSLRGCQLNYLANFVGEKAYSSLLTVSNSCLKMSNDSNCTWRIFRGFGVLENPYKWFKIRLCRGLRVAMLF